MRIAVAADAGGGLDGPICPHFGKAREFILVDCTDGAIERWRSVENPFADGHRHGEIPLFLHEAGVHSVLSGGMGAGAITMFQRLGMTPVTGAHGSVQHSVELYLSGALGAAAPCADSVAHRH